MKKEPEEKTDMETAFARMTTPGTSPRLVIRDASGATWEYPLKQGETLIGRSTECGITLDDSAASRNHAVIASAQEGWTLKDLGSTNGTLLRGEKVEEETALRNGDEIRIGDHTLTFRIEEPEEHEEEGVDKTVFLEEDKTVFLEEDKTAFHTGADAEEMPGASLTVLSGKDKGTIYYLVQRETGIGRTDENEIPLKLENVSRRHARITYREGGFLLSDLGSANGVLLNGERIEERELSTGDLIQIGEVLLEFSLEKAGGEATAEAAAGRRVRLKVVLPAAAAVLLLALLFLAIRPGRKGEKKPAVAEAVRGEERQREARKHLERAEKLLEENNPAEAARSCETALQILPGWEEAVSLKERALQKIRTKERLAEAEKALALGKLDEADAIAESVLRREPGHREADRIREAVGLRRAEERSTEALAQAEKLFLEGKADEALARLAAVEEGAKAPAGARELRERIEKRREAIAIFEEARASYRKGEAKRAFASLDEALREDPSFADPRLLRERMKKMEAHEKRADAAFEDKDYYEAFRNLNAMLALEKDGETLQRKKAEERLAKMRPILYLLADDSYRKAVGLLAEGQDARALRLFRRAAEMDPQLEGAVREAERLADRMEKSAGSLYIAAYLLEDSDRERSMKILQRAIAVAPPESEIPAKAKKRLGW